MTEGRPTSPGQHNYNGRPRGYNGPMTTIHTYGYTDYSTPLLPVCRNKLTGESETPSRLSPTYRNNTCRIAYRLFCMVEVGGSPSEYQYINIYDGTECRRTTRQAATRAANSAFLGSLRSPQNDDTLSKHTIFGKAAWSRGTYNTARVDRSRENRGRRYDSRKVLGRPSWINQRW
jgi:hypothetical protein